MRLGAKSIGGWVGSLGACNKCGGRSNHAHILKITDMTITIIFHAIKEIGKRKGIRQGEIYSTSIYTRIVYYCIRFIVGCRDGG